MVVEEPSKQRTVRPSPKPRPNPQRGQRLRKAEEIESEIAALEEQLGELTNQLAKPSADWGPEEYAGIGRRQNELQARLEPLYREWEAANPPSE